MKATLLSTVLYAGQALAFALPNPIEDLIGETLELVHLEHLDKRVCPHDNLLRCLIGTPSLAVPFCSSTANVIATTPTVFVTLTPTATATSTSTTLQTVTSTTSTTNTQTTSTTITVAPPTSTVYITYIKKRTTTISDGGGGGGGGQACTPVPDLSSKRAVAATSLACLTNLKPSASAISSACSCFSGSYTPAAVTETFVAPTVTVTPFVVGVTQSVTRGITVTVDTVVTVTLTSTSTIAVCTVTAP